VTQALAKELDDEFDSFALGTERVPSSPDEKAQARRGARVQRYIQEAMARREVTVSTLAEESHEGRAALEREVNAKRVALLAMKFRSEEEREIELERLEMHHWARLHQLPDGLSFYELAKGLDSLLQIEVTEADLQAVFPDVTPAGGRVPLAVMRHMIRPAPDPLRSMSPAAARMRAKMYGTQQGSLSSPGRSASPPRFSLKSPRLAFDFEYSERPSEAERHAQVAFGGSRATFVPDVPKVPPRHQSSPPRVYQCDTQSDATNATKLGKPDQGLHTFKWRI